VWAESHIHILKSVKEYEGMNSHTSKWTPFWELKSLRIFESLENDLRGQHSLD
jgi:hypothetical protein